MPHSHLFDTNRSCFEHSFTFIVYIFFPLSLHVHRQTRCPYRPYGSSTPINVGRNLQISIKCVILRGSWEWEWEGLIFFLLYKAIFLNLFVRTPKLKRSTTEKEMLDAWSEHQKNDCIGRTGNGRRREWTPLFLRGKMKRHSGLTDGLTDGQTLL